MAGVKVVRSGRLMAHATVAGLERLTALLLLLD